MKNSNNPKILVLGGSGFIGIRLITLLRSQSYPVIGISFNKKNTYCVQCDIRDLASLKKVFSKYKPEIIFHVAGVSTVEEGINNPKRTLSINTKITKNILYCIRKYNVKRTIIASTIQVYSSSNTPHDESDSYINGRPYESSKASSDQLISSYGSKYNLPIILTRLVNIYGPNDNHLNRLIPKIIHEGLTKKMITLWGDGLIMRDFIYIDDVVKILIYLSQCSQISKSKPEIINIGSENIHSVLEVGKIVSSILKVSLKINSFPLRENEDPYLIANLDKMKKLVPDFKFTSLPDGLLSTVESYKKSLVDTNNYT